MNPQTSTANTSIIGILSLFILFFAGGARAQNVGINGTGAAPNTSAMLDVASSTKGILIPQVALTGATDATTITTGNVNSLLVYNTATAGSGSTAIVPGYYYWNSTAGRWYQLVPGGAAQNTAFTGFQVFQYTGGAQTFTIPSGVTKVMIEAWGGGGGGGGSSYASGIGNYGGNGGGGGGYGKGLFTVSSNLTITVGAGGSAGAGGGNGGAGGNTTISGGASMTVNGGAGGSKGLTSGATPANAAGGSGPAIGSSILGIAGTTGALSTDFGGGGLGGFAPCGGPGGVGTSDPGTAGTVPGGGGGGAATPSSGTTQYAGGAGGAGMVIVWW